MNPTPPKSPMASSPTANADNFDFVIATIMDIMNHPQNELTLLLNIGRKFTDMDRRDSRACMIDGIRTLLYENYLEVFNEYNRVIEQNRPNQGLQFAVPSGRSNLVSFVIENVGLPNINYNLARQILEDQIAQCADLVGKDLTADLKDGNGDDK